MSFKNLKSKSENNNRLTKMVEDIQSRNNKPDRSNYWSLTRDAAGNGFAVIRFLPEPPQDGDDAVPFIKYFDHGFKSGTTQQWYIEKSRTTLGEPDFMAEYNSKLWNSGIKENVDLARYQGRRTRYVSNIYVVRDSKNPENEGKVFLFEYGTKIHAKLLAKIKPEFEDDQAVDIFDMWKGANFKLKARKIDGQINYDLSEFEAPSALLEGNEEKLEKVWQSEYSLKDIISPDKFKSYEDLKARAIKVLNLSEEGTPATPRQNKPTRPPIDTSVLDEAKTDESDEDLNFFQNLVDDDIPF
jgi:hypothetical protein